MQIYTGAQIKSWDTYTLEHEPIRAIDLMERAARAMVGVLVERYGPEHHIVALAGPGNNGGDALAMARLLAVHGYTVEAYLFNTTTSLSDECATNKKRLQSTKGVKAFVEVSTDFSPPALTATTVVIDGLFGSGLNKPLSGGYAELVKYVNASNAIVVSIDLPSGLRTEDNTNTSRQHIIRATLTLALQQKKLAMYLADNEPYLGEVVVVEIGLAADYLQKVHSPYNLVEERDICPLLRRRSPYAHKGTMGHSLLLAGSYGMAGAASLAARAALRSGTGKCTVHTPLCNNDILQTTVPEVVLHHDKGNRYITEIMDTADYDAVAIGPGIGQHEQTAIALMSQIGRIQCPLVLDADALNILSTHREWLHQLPRHLILTPHPAECDRLAGSQAHGSYNRLTSAMLLAAHLNAYIILKGHHTALCCHEGEVFINTTGNAGMATAGAGDVLTGIITALLSRGYPRREACMVGVYVHGLAGDIASERLGQESLIASDIIDALPEAFKRLYTNSKQYE